MNDYKSIKDLYNNSWKLFIQPPKCFYNDYDILDQIECQHSVLSLEKFQILNKFRHKINCCLYLPDQYSDQRQGEDGKSSSRVITHSSQPGNSPADPIYAKSTFKNIRRFGNSIPCIIYLHSQGGNVMEGLFISKVCAKFNVALCTFDFAACGKSEGDFISLGWNEQDDLDVLINHLQCEYSIGKIGLWGRSMGAVTSILYAERNAFNLECLVVDSPFLHLEKSVINLAKNKMRIAPFLSSMMLKLINSKIVERIGFNVLDIRVDSIVKSIDLPMVLIASKNDDLVAFEDFEYIYKHYGSRKVKMVLTDKCHNEFRENFVTAEALAYMLAHILEKKDVTKEEIVKILEIENFATASITSNTRDPSFDLIQDNFDSSKLCLDLKNAIGNMQMNAKHRNHSVDPIMPKGVKEAVETERRLSRAVDDRVAFMKDALRSNHLGTIHVPESEKNVRMYQQYKCDASYQNF